MGLLVLSQVIQMGGGEVCGDFSQLRVILFNPEYLVGFGLESSKRRKTK